MANNHGGKRLGAGRPQGRMGRRHLVVLSDEDWDVARRIGEGNASLGIRRALVYHERYPQPYDPNDGTGTMLPRQP